MIGHFESRSPCVVCGHHNRTLHLSAVIRVNKRSLRVTSQPVMTWLSDWPCPECGSKDPTNLNRPERAVLCPKSKAEIEQIRARRWPERERGEQGAGRA